MKPIFKTVFIVLLASVPICYFDELLGAISTGYNNRIYYLVNNVIAGNQIVGL